MSKILVHLSVIEDRLNKVTIIADISMMVGSILFLYGDPIAAIASLIMGNCLLWGLRALFIRAIDKRRRIVARRREQLRHLRKRKY